MPEGKAARELPESFQALASTHQSKVGKERWVWRPKSRRRVVQTGSRFARPRVTLHSFPPSYSIGRNLYHGNIDFSNIDTPGSVRAYSPKRHKVLRTNS